MHHEFVGVVVCVRYETSSLCRTSCSMDFCASTVEARCLDEADGRSVMVSAEYLVVRSCSHAGYNLNLSRIQCGPESQTTSQALMPGFDARL